MIKITFGQRFKELRNRKGLTLDELKIIFKTTKATLSRYENNKNNPDSEFIVFAANFFNVSTDYILGLTNIENHQFKAPESNVVDVLHSSEDDLSTKEKRLIDFFRSLESDSENK